MLVLTRKTQQQIQIGNNVTLTILRIKGTSVRVGIEAPDGVRIMRAELVDTSDGMPPGSWQEVPEPLPARSASEARGGGVSHRSPLKPGLNLEGSDTFCGEPTLLGMN